MSIAEDKNPLTLKILERIKTRSRELGFKEAFVSKQVEENKPDLIRNWRRLNVLPRLDKLIEVAKVLDVKPEWLIFGATQTGISEVPLLSWVSA